MVCVRRIQMSTDIHIRSPALSSIFKEYFSNCFLALNELPVDGFLFYVCVCVCWCIVFPFLGATPPQATPSFCGHNKTLSVLTCG